MDRKIITSLKQIARLVEQEPDDVIEAFIVGSHWLGDGYTGLFGLFPYLKPGSCQEPSRRVAVAIKLLKDPVKLYAVDLAHMAITGGPAFPPNETCYVVVDEWQFPVSLWQKFDYSGLAVDEFDLDNMTGLEKRLIFEYAGKDLREMGEDIRKLGRQVFTLEFVRSAGEKGE